MLTWFHNHFFFLTLKRLHVYNGLALGKMRPLRGRIKLATVAINIKSLRDLFTYDHTSVTFKTLEHKASSKLCTYGIHAGKKNNV